MFGRNHTAKEEAKANEPDCIVPLGTIGSYKRWILDQVNTLEQKGEAAFWAPASAGPQLTVEKQRLMNGCVEIFQRWRDLRDEEMVAGCAEESEKDDAKEISELKNSLKLKHQVLEAWRRYGDRLQTQIDGLRSALRDEKATVAHLEQCNNSQATTIRQYQAADDGLHGATLRFGRVIQEAQRFEDALKGRLNQNG